MVPRARNATYVAQISIMRRIARTKTKTGATGRKGTQVGTKERRSTVNVTTAESEVTMRKIAGRSTPTSTLLNQKSGAAVLYNLLVSNVDYFDDNDANLNKNDGATDKIIINNEEDKVNLESFMNDEASFIGACNEEASEAIIEEIDPNVDLEIQTTQSREEMQNIKKEEMTSDKTISELNRLKESRMNRCT